ncbi:Carbamoyl-phosphate synthase large chain [Frankliniella fusca]|uniref:Carbamoyl-phosphate synthase large chain n=1 Tax=Frankliniella fusca TaxID=407009 RepID=A0AAE1LCP1_9NEOP|nr:Carbamoyl-phosphate synthase large chain [Frankliniella fusca]
MKSSENRRKKKIIIDRDSNTRQKRPDSLVGLGRGAGTVTTRLSVRTLDSDANRNPYLPAWTGPARPRRLSLRFRSCRLPEKMAGRE